MSTPNENIDKAMNIEFNHEITCEININPTGDAEYASLGNAFKNIAMAMKLRNGIKKYL